MTGTTAVAVAGMMLSVLAAPALAAGGTVAGSTNIAAAQNGGKVVAVSSEAMYDTGQVMPHWSARNAIDGLFVVGNHTPPESYCWSTQTPPAPSEPHWVILSFGAEAKTHLISRIVIDPTTDDPAVIGRWVKTIEVQVSVTEKDGPYRSVGRYMVVNRPIKQAFDFPPVECRFLKLLIHENHGSDRCVELGEIEVYEAIVGEDQLDQLIIQMENLLNDLKKFRDAARYQDEKQTLEGVTTKPEPAPEQ